VKATQRIYRAPGTASFIDLPVVSGAGTSVTRAGE